MGNRPTHEITTPIGSHVIIIKDWLTGRERENIEQAQYAQVNAQPRQMGGKSTMDFDKINAGAIVTEQTHRLFTTYIVSVDGNTDNILDVVLDMHEDDTDFIFTHVADKKKPIAPEVAA